MPRAPTSRPALTGADYRFLLRNDFTTFAHRSFCEVRPGSFYQPGQHVELIGSWLDACRLGERRRLIVNLPPRSLKSILASVAFPAWLVGHDPNLSIICASYGQDLAETHARDCKALMNSSWYQGLFPRTRLVRQAVNDLGTTAHGSRLATSVGGPLTGRGADVIIIDDPLKPDEALSDVRRKAVNDWFDNSLLSRLNNQKTGVIVIVMQRLHSDDLVGHVLEKGGWEVLSLPAMAEEDENFRYQTILGPRCFRRRAGEPLEPVRLPVERLTQLRADIGPYNFAAQYQQSPIPLEGNLVKRSWLVRYSASDIVGTLPMIVQSWDTANKATELNDYSVCTTWDVHDRRYRLLDVFRQRLEFPELKRAVREQVTRHRPQIVLIEDKASGTQLIQELQREGLYVVQAVQAPAGTDKVMRLHMHTATFENGRVLLPEEAPWLDTYIAELTGFPGGKHDDQVDSTTQALTFLDAYEPPMIISDELLARSSNPAEYIGGPWEGR